MMSKITQVLFVMIVFLIGWYANQFWQQLHPHPVEATIFPGSLNKDRSSGILLNNDINQVFNQNCNCETDTQYTLALQPLKLSFETLLHSNRYVEALELFAQSKNGNGLDSSKLKLSLIAYMEGLISDRLDSEFTELTDLYLGEYYDDLDILLLLVKFNWIIGYYSEAVNVLQLAYTYSYTPEQSKQFDDAYSEFIQNADKMLFEQARYFELLNLYFSIETSGLLRSVDKLRIAEIYLLNGEPTYARQILEQLSTDATWGTRAKEILNQLDEAQIIVAEGAPIELNFSQNISLQTVGNQYLVPVLLSGNNLKLILDTGASMTTITLRDFEKLQQITTFERAGTHMFNTANGVTKGIIYRIDSIYVGRFEIRNSLIAVLDFNIAEHASGLLGMNTLREFRFQIDQDNDLLRLEKR